MGEIRSEIGKSRQRAGLWVAGLAAAVVLLAAGWIAIDRSNPANSIPAPAAKGDGQVASAEVTPPRAVVIGGSDTLVMPIESRWPNVTIVKVYVAYQPNVNGGSP